MRNIVVQDTPDRLLSEPELAEKLSASRRSVVDWRMAGKIPHIRVGKLVRYDWAQVVAHLKKTTAQN